MNSNKGTPDYRELELRNLIRDIQAGKYGTWEADKLVTEYCDKKATEAVIKKLEELKSKKLHRKVISPKMISIYDEEFVKVSELTEVINQLRASIQEGEHGQGKKTTP